WLDAAELAREDDRRGVVAFRLGEDLATERGRLPVRALQLERLGAERLQAAPLARRHRGTRGDEPRQHLRLELRLERVERGAERAPRDGAVPPLEEREQEVERDEPVALREAELRRG